MQCQPGTILSNRQYRLHQQLHQDGPIQYWSAHQLSTHAPPQRKLLQIPLPIYLRHYERTQQLDALTYYDALYQSPHIVLVEYVETLTDPNLIALAPPPGQLLNLVLQNYHRAHALWPWELAVYIAVQVCVGLHHGHTTEDPLYQLPFILHGNIRPESLFLTEQGNILLLPFGQLNLWGDLQEAWPYAVKRRYAYAAPERWIDDGSQIQPQIDLFSVGILIYELLTGQLPYDGTNVEAVKKQIVSPALPSLRRHVSHLPSRLEAVVYQLIHADPQERPDSAEEVAQTLVQLLSKELGAQGYQKQLSEIYQKFAQPFAPAYPTMSAGVAEQTPLLPPSQSFPTSIRSQPPGHADQALVYATQVENLSLKNSSTSVGSSENSPFLPTEDLPTQTRKTQSAAMSKDPLNSSHPGPHSSASRTSTPSTAQNQGQGQGHGIPSPHAVYTPPPASPFSAAPPHAAYEEEHDFDPESTVVDGSVIQALRKAMNAGATPPTLPPASAQVAPSSSNYSAATRVESPSSNSLTGRFKKYTPPSQELPASPSLSSMEQDTPTAKASAPSNSSSPMTWVDSPGRRKISDTQPPTFVDANYPPPTDPGLTEPLPTTVNPSSWNSGYDEDDGEATSIAPVGSLAPPPSSFFSQAAPAAPVVAQRISPPPPPPPAPALPTQNPNTPNGNVSLQDKEMGESTGVHATHSRPRSPNWPSPSPHTLSSSPAGVETPVPSSPWSSSTDTGSPYSPPGLSEALFPTHEEESDDPTFLHVPTLSSQTGGYPRSMPYSSAEPAFAPAVPSLPNHMSGSFQAQSSQALGHYSHPQSPQHGAFSADLFSNVAPTSVSTPSTFDPAQPLAPLVPEYQFTYDRAPQEAAMPLDPALLSHSQETSRPSSFRWMVPVLLLLLVGGGTGASVLLLGWPPWKSLLESSSQETTTRNRAILRDLPKTPRLVSTRPPQTPPVHREPGVVPPVTPRRDVPNPNVRTETRQPEERDPEERDPEERPRPRPQVRTTTRRPALRRTRVATPRRRPAPRLRTVRVARVSPTIRSSTTANKTEVRVAIQPACTLYKGKQSLGQSFPERPLNLSPGNHSLRCINKSLRLLHEFSLLVVAEQSTVYRRKLQAGTLILKSKPWATIHIQGLGNIGKTGQPVSVYEGRFRATLYKQGSNLPTPGNRQTLWLTILPGRENKPDLVVFPVLDDDL